MVFETIKEALGLKEQTRPCNMNCWLCTERCCLNCACCDNYIKWVGPQICPENYRVAILCDYAMRREKLYPRFVHIPACDRWEPRNPKIFNKK